MTKILKIDSCYDCTYHTEEDVVVKCVLVAGILTVQDADMIPLWCPLPNASQQAVEGGRATHMPICRACGERRGWHLKICRAKEPAHRLTFR